jgi:predicted Fe-Mo cluster-binding NifX family protein
VKIAISSTGNSLISKIDSRFGRATYFVFIEAEGGEILRSYAVENRVAEAPAGAGTEAAQQVIREGVKAVISGAVGPNAYEIFERLGIDVFLAQGDLSVEEVYEKFEKGVLRKMTIKRL